MVSRRMYYKNLPHIIGNEVKPYKENNNKMITTLPHNNTSPTKRERETKPACYLCARIVLQRCHVNTASHQTTHTTIGYLQVAEGLHADSSFNLCTMSITLCLDQTTNPSNIPPKSSHVIVTKLIARTIEQL
jgi:hypothetical protein